MTPTLRKLALLVAVFVAVQLAPAAPAAAQAVITNGTVTLGVNAHGQLNVPGPPSPIVGTPLVGLRYNANGWEALSHHSPCEGWGVAIANIPVSGWANQCFDGPGEGGPVNNLALQDFSFTADSATSNVFLPNPFATGHNLLQVTHAWGPSAWPTLYQGNVRIANVNGGFLGDAASPVGDIRYRRVMDWDVEPTTAEDIVSIGGIDGPGPLTPAYLLFSGDNGFEVADPLRFENGAPVDVFAAVQATFGVANPVPCGFTRNFTNCGRFVDPAGDPVVVDHGAMLDFAFPGLAVGAAHEFAIFYGAAASREEAEMALYMVGAEVYSLANCRPLEPGFGGFAGCDPVSGAPVTFVFAAAGVGGSPVFGDVSGTVYQDLNANGAFDSASDTPLAGVTLTLTGSDLSGNAITRATTTAADGTYTFMAVARGSYSVSAPAGSGTLVHSTASSLAVTVGGASPYVTGIDFGYVAPVSVAGTAYTDMNANGAFDSGTDTPLAGITITLTGPGGTQTVTTSTNGTYSVGGLLPGTYTVSAPAGAGMQPLVTPSPLTLTLSAGQQGVAAFGYRRPVNVPVTAISGIVYTDVDRNHVFNPATDTPLAGVTITLAGPGGTRTVTTDAGGGYGFTGLAPGRYRVSAPGTVNSEPRITDSPVAVTLAAGQQRIVNFGYHQPPRATIHGVVYTEQKDNGEFNRGKDTPLAGVTVTLSGPGGTLTTTTGADGTYAFDGLLPGRYTVGVPATLNGQPTVTRNPVTRDVYGGQHRVDFGYRKSSPPPCGHDRCGGEHH